MRRFNYTSRKKILRDDVKVRLHGRFDESPVVDVSVDLVGYDFPTDSQVFLEAQRKTRFVRLALGTAVPSVRRNHLVLNEFDDAEDISFRVKVTDRSQGLLLGIAEKIRPCDKDDQYDENQKSILPVSSVDLSAYGVLWRIDYQDESAVLQIEKELGSREQVVRSYMFRGFILPAAMRQILVRVTSEDWDEELSEPDDLATRWLLFAKQIGAGLPDKDEERHDEWIDDALKILCARIGIRDQAITEFQAGVWK